MIERFSAPSFLVMTLSRRAAQRHGDVAIRPEHVLLGLLDVEGPQRDLLAARAGSVEVLRGLVERAIARERRPSAAGPAALPFTDTARAALVSAAAEADALARAQIEPEDLLMGVLLADAEGLAGRALTAVGLDATTLRSELAGAPGVRPATAAPDDVPGQLLELSLALRDLGRAHDAQAARLERTQALLRRACGLLVAVVVALIASVLLRWS